MNQPGFGDPQEELRQVVLRRLEAARTEKHWQPLPHQVPPPGNWRGWLLLAGRGAGKTEACAHYVDEHVNGPACLSLRQAATP
jgi:phage terminase large subunit-like protein